MIKQFDRGEPKALLDLRIGMTSTDPNSKQTTTIRSYCEFVDYMLRSYATEDVLHYAVYDLEHFAQPSGSNELDYARQLWEKAVKYGNVFSERSMKTIFTNGVDHPIQLSVRKHMVDNPNSDLTMLAREALNVGNVAGVRPIEGSP